MQRGQWRLLCDTSPMRVARVNVDKNINILNSFINSTSVPADVKFSIEENNEDYPGFAGAFVQKEEGIGEV